MPSSQPNQEKGIGANFSRDALAIRDVYAIQLITHQEGRANLARLGLTLEPWPFEELPPPPPPPAPPQEALTVYTDTEDHDYE